MLLVLEFLDTYQELFQIHILILLLCFYFFSISKKIDWFSMIVSINNYNKN